MAYPHGVEPEPRRRAQVRMIGYDAEASPTAFARLNRVAEAIQLVVPIAATFPLGQASKAHARVERGHVVGRIVLKSRRSVAQIVAFSRATHHIPHTRHRYEDVVSKLKASFTFSETR